MQLTKVNNMYVGVWKDSLTYVRTIQVLPTYILKTHELFTHSSFNETKHFIGPAMPGAKYTHYLRITCETSVQFISF